MNCWKRLVALFGVLFSLTTLQAVDFIQLTDPHIFDGKEGDAENKVALQWVIKRVNADAASGRAVEFVVVTGDLGLEGLKTNAAVVAAAKELGLMLNESSVERWYFVPGNNDLDGEDPATVGKYHQFVEELRKYKSGVTDLCEPASGSFAVHRCRFFGFNNASFKGNGSEADARKFESAQLQEIARLNKDISEGDFDHAFVFYHIPEANDPYYELRSDEELRDRTAIQNKLGHSNPRSSWTVTQNVRQAWSAVLTNPRLSARFTGHFHSDLRGKYGLFTEPLLDWNTHAQLFICPPVAGKRQENSRIQARGYLRISVDCAKNKVIADPVWYDKPADIHAGGVVDPSLPAGSAGKPLSLSAASQPPLESRPSISSGLGFSGVFIGLLVGIVALTVVVWRSIQTRLPSTTDATLQTTLVVGTVFLSLVMVGFVTIASLAASQGQDAFRVVSVGALWALAALAVGSAIGFLFGVPHTTGPTPPVGNGNSSQTPPEPRMQGTKTNLEEIADWLSKLIIGGTLFQSGRILEWLGQAGDEFAITVGSDARLWRGVGSSSLVYFGLVGFFGGHFITRLYLIGALRRADEGDRPVVADRANLTKEQLTALEAAPFNLETAGGEFDPIAREAANRIGALRLDDLTNWKDIRLWAKAKLSKGSFGDKSGSGTSSAEDGARNTAEAIKGYQKAIEIVPNDAEAHLGYAVALANSGSAPYLVLNQLEAARGSLMLNSSKDLRKNVYKSLTGYCLTLKRPESFLSVFRYAAEYFRMESAVQSSGLWVNVARAYGQCYSWMKDDSRNVIDVKRISVVEEPNAESFSVGPDYAMQKALEAIKAAISRDETVKKRLRQAMESEDGDLKPFKFEPEFRAILINEL